MRFRRRSFVRVKLGISNLKSSDESVGSGVLGVSASCYEEDE